MHAVAGNNPSLCLRPAMQGLSNIEDEKLWWKGSSQAGLAPLTDTHLKQSMAFTPENLLYLRKSKKI